MKKLLLILLACFPLVVNAAPKAKSTTPKNQNVTQKNKNTAQKAKSAQQSKKKTDNNKQTKQSATKKSNSNEKLQWSYRALAEATKEKTTLLNRSELEELGHWFLDVNAKFSFGELKNKCEQIKKCEKKKDCKTACDTFAKTLREKNNVVKKEFKKPNPGTYVKETTVKDEMDGKNIKIYKIFDVIMADGYMDGNNINHTINIADKNTGIYLINKQGKVTDTNLHTWTNDMFLNISSSKDVRGYVRGAHLNSYIKSDRDLTESILCLDPKNYAKGIIAEAWEGIKKAPGLMPNGGYDIKNHYSRKYTEGTTKQTDSDAHVNGMKFCGKIAHAEWLGHLIYSMNNKVDKENRVVTLLSKATNNNQLDSLQVREAWEIGQDISRYCKEDIPRVNCDFVKNTQIETVVMGDVARSVPDAVIESGQKMKSMVPGCGEIDCRGRCVDNIVQCSCVNKSLGNTVYKNFKFDHLCYDLDNMLKKLKDKVKKINYN